MTPATSEGLPVGTSARSVSRCRRLGAAGAIALTMGSLGAGALPAHDPSGLWLWHGPKFAQLGLALAYTGLVLLVAAWWRLGSLIARGTRVDARDVLITLAWWTAPLCVGPPLYSSDVYSYVAQGAMALRGLDVYRLGPAALGGIMAHNVAHVWRWTPSPYGPVFMGVAKFVVRATGQDVVAGVLGMRAAAMAGIGLIVWAVRRLAPAAGVAEAGALWLGVLNPLVLIHLAAGAHNDALMIGLMMAGFVLTRQDRPVLGTVLVALAMLIKWPAGIGLLFLPALWRGVPGRAGRCVWVAAVAAATVVVTTALARTGYGWLVTQHAPIAIRTPMSVTTDIGQPVGALAEALGVADAHQTLAVVQELGIGGALAVVAVWARRIMRRDTKGADVGTAAVCHPEYALGMSLLAIVALAPVVQPWYVLWGLIPIAATGWDRALGDILKVVSAGLAFLVLPSGNGLDPEIIQSALACIALAAIALRLRRSMAARQRA